MKRTLTIEYGDEVLLAMPFALCWIISRSYDFGWMLGHIKMC